MTYIDIHGAVFPSREFLEGMKGNIRDKKRDQWGVQPLGLYYNEQGRAYCITEAPSAEAVKKTHDSLGVAVDEIVPVKSLI